MRRPSTCLIYALLDPRTGLVHYVGQTRIGMRRPLQHVSRSAREPAAKRAWVQGLEAEGLKPVIRVLERVERPSRLPAAERKWIARGRRAGWPLVNVRVAAAAG